MQKPVKGCDRIPHNHWDIHTRHLPPLPHSQLSDTRSRFLGTKPPRLVPTVIRGMRSLLALSSRAWLGYSDQGRFNISPLSYEALSYASGEEQALLLQAEVLQTIQTQETPILQQQQNPKVHLIMAELPTLLQPLLQLKTRKSKTCLRVSFLQLSIITAINSKLFQDNNNKLSDKSKI